MKKLVSILIVVSMLLIASTAFATTNPLEGKTIYVIDEFNKFKDTDDAELTSGDFTTEKGDVFWSDYNDGSTTVRLGDGKIQLLNGTGKMDFRVQTFGVTTASEAFAGKTFDGIGYYVENNTAAAIDLGSYMIADGAWLLALNEDVTLVALDGTATVAEAGAPAEWGGLTISVPAGFKGYVLIPVGNLVNAWSGMAVFVPGTDNVGTFGLMISTLSIGASESVVFDNHFAYGGDIPSNNDNVIVFGDAEPTDTNTNEPVETADVSVLAYAAASILGLGSLVVIRRKK